MLDAILAGEKPRTLAHSTISSEWDSAEEDLSLWPFSEEAVDFRSGEASRCTRLLEKLLPKHKSIYAPGWRFCLEIAFVHGWLAFHFVVGTGYTALPAGPNATQRAQKCLSSANPGLTPARGPACQDQDGLSSSMAIAKSVAKTCVAEAGFHHAGCLGNHLQKDIYQCCWRTGLIKTDPADTGAFPANTNGDRSSTTSGLLSGYGESLRLGILVYKESLFGDCRLSSGSKRVSPLGDEWRLQLLLMVQLKTHRVAHVHQRRSVGYDSVVFAAAATATATATAAYAYHRHLGRSPLRVVVMVVLRGLLGLLVVGWMM
ncbi:hypothetical protein EYF80_005651 [Liparis tanakae]|uniref:Uncharacterized protein n=1 Tax=Liparis tanakae TaxID=230148 RepID=A0A4Z2J152_9TELE|nr:hypothetical protein EYF80_005651 [Liparis tanakae]